MFLETALFKILVSIPYNFAKSESIMTFCFLIMKIRF